MKIKYLRFLIYIAGFLILLFLQFHQNNISPFESQVQWKWNADPAIKSKLMFEHQLHVQLETIQNDEYSQSAIA